MGGEVLKGADAYMAAGDSRQHRPRQEFLSRDLLAGADCRQGASGGNAEGVHRLADKVLAQYRADWRPSVASAGIGGGARSFQLDVIAMAGGVHDLAQQDGTSVTQLRVVAAKLVPGVDAGEGLCTVWNGIAGHHGKPFRRG